MLCYMIQPRISSIIPRQWFRISSGKAAPGAQLSDFMLTNRNIFYTFFWPIQKGASGFQTKHKYFSLWKALARMVLGHSEVTTLSDQTYSTSQITILHYTTVLSS